MKEQFVKWMPILAIACFAAAVFMIADGFFWPGIAFIGAGASLSSAAAVWKKKNDDADTESRKRNKEDENADGISLKIRMEVL